MPIAIVRQSDGRVQTFVRDDVPEGWLPPEGFDSVPADQLPAGWQMVEPEPPQIPVSISPRQARLALLGAGLLEAAAAAVNQAGPVAKIYWEYAVEWRRDEPVLNQLAAALGLTSQQLDQMFVEAAQL